MDIKLTDQKDLYQTGPGSFVYYRPGSAIDQYKNVRGSMEQRDASIKDMLHGLEETKAKINNIEDDLFEIKLLLTQLCKGK